MPTLVTTRWSLEREDRNYNLVAIGITRIEMGFSS